jgi:hypothetical protein
LGIRNKLLVIFKRLFVINFEQSRYRDIPPGY